MEPATPTTPAAESTPKLPVLPAVPAPIPLANWKAPPPPRPTPMKISKPNVMITLTAKDPLHPSRNTGTMETEPPVTIKCPPSLYDWSNLLKDLIGGDDTPGVEKWDESQPFDYDVPYRARVVNKLLEWVDHYTESPEPNEWTPETRREMMKTRNLQKKPDFIQNYEAEKKISETVPEWDRTVWFKLGKRLDEDGDEENVYVMNPDDKGLFFEVCRMADLLRIDKLCNHISKIYTLAFIRGRTPDEIAQEGAFTPKDRDYWTAVYLKYDQPDTDAKTETKETKEPTPEPMQVTEPAK